jgi:TolB protein
LDLRTGQRSDLPHLNNAASFSPDGRFLVSANYPADPGLKTEIVELDRRTGQVRTYASAPSLEWLASYSADGRWILFNSTRTGASDLYRVRRSDGQVEQLTSDPRYEAHAQYFEGHQKLIFHRQTDGDNYDIIIRDLRTGGETPVGPTPAEEAYPAISPDEKWIAFSAVTDPNAQPHLFIMKTDGSGRRQLTDDAAKDAYAAWAPNGRDLYFVRFASDGSKIYRLAIERGDCAR